LILKKLNPHRPNQPQIPQTQSFKSQVYKHIASNFAAQTQPNRLNSTHKINLTKILNTTHESQYTT